MDEDLQCIRMVSKDVEATTSDDDTRLLGGNLPDGFCLCIKEFMLRLVMFCTVILGLTQVVLIEVGEVVAP
jgi:hypothetical protein